MKKGYLLIADILGFSNIVKNLSDADLTIRINDWTNLLKQLSEKHKLFNFQLLSDTLFLCVEGHDEKDLERLIVYCQDLMEAAIIKSIPIKGAITYGQFEWGDYIYGKPVIEAHEIESKQNWLGITLQPKIPNADKLFTNSKLVVYPTPMKSGPVKLMPVLTWDIPDFNSLILLLSKNGLAKEGEVFEWQWAEKIKNTIEFRIYLKILKKNNLEPNSFYGFLPTQIIELNL